MDIIGFFAEFVASMIPGGEDSKPVRIVVSFLVYMSILGVIAFARPIAMQIPFFRRRLAKGEAYAGKYVQIISSGENRRYSIVEIFFDSKFRGYLLKGNQYDQNGNRAIDFTSQNVAFREGPINYFEFVWRAETISDKGRFDGYTMMFVDDKSNPKMFEGRGFFITFDNTPRRFNLRFFKITKERLEEFENGGTDSGLKEPITEQDRHNFVKRLHTCLNNHPSLQPTEESEKPVL